MTLDHLAALARLAARAADELDVPVRRHAAMVRETPAARRGLLSAGDGGSAAPARHLAAEDVVPCRRERRAVRALALAAAVDQAVVVPVVRTTVRPR